MTDLTSVKNLLDNCRAFLTSFRVKGLFNAVVFARKSSENTEIEPLRYKRISRAKGLKKIATFFRDLSSEMFSSLMVASVITDYIFLLQGTDEIAKHHSFWGFFYDISKL